MKHKPLICLFCVYRFVVKEGGGLPPPEVPGIFVARLFVFSVFVGFISYYGSTF
jgi:hypothetical protein